MPSYRQPVVCGSCAQRTHCGLAFILDSNKYEGLWRDHDDVDSKGESQGERRLFPIFVGQHTDERGMTGDVRWREEFSVDYDKLPGEFWQMMKECEAVQCAEGKSGYDKMVKRTTAMVREFSRKEKAADQGTVRDKVLDEHFAHVMSKCNKSFGSVLIEGEKFTGVKIVASDVLRCYQGLSKRPVTVQSISRKICAMGGKKGFSGSGAAKVTAYVFDEFAAMDPSDKHAWNRAFIERHLPDYLEISFNPDEKNGDGF